MILENSWSHKLVTWGHFEETQTLAFVCFPLGVKNSLCFNLRLSSKGLCVFVIILSVMATWHRRGIACRSVGASKHYNTAKKLGQRLLYCKKYRVSWTVNREQLLLGSSWDCIVPEWVVKQKCVYFS